MLTAFDSSKQLVATSSPTFARFFATSTTATSTMNGALRLGFTAAAKDSLIFGDCSDRVYPPSATIGGCVHINNGTVNTGPALE